jgi:hypothetical protein
MQLSETGESRIRGYLYILNRSIRAAVPSQLAADAVREVESHIRERVAESAGSPNERDALEAILTRLGKPMDVARAYSLEAIMDEASVGGRLLSMLAAILRVAATGVKGFLMAIALFAGYGIGSGFIAVALLKPVFPHNVGFWMVGRFPTLGAQFPAPPGVEPLGGYWLIPIAITIGLAILIGVHRTARRWIASVREKLALRKQLS